MINYTQITTHIIALIIVISVIFLFSQGQEVPDLLVGAFGLVVAQYLRRQTEDDVHTSSERVLGNQVVVGEAQAQAR